MIKICFRLKHFEKHAVRVKGLNKSKSSYLINKGMAEFKCLHNSSYLGLVYTWILREPLILSSLASGYNKMVFLTNEFSRFLGLWRRFRVFGGIISPSLVRLAQFFVSLYMPRVGSRQASLNKLIWCTLLCYLLCSGDKIWYFWRMSLRIRQK